MSKITLNSLINFVCENAEESEAFNKYSKVVTDYYNKTKEKYYGGCYYLGGQLRMSLDDELSLESIKKVREINAQKLIELGGPCNSWEQQSMWTSERQLNEMENLIKIVHNIFTAREAIKTLDNTNLNSDVNSSIISYLL